MSRRRQGLWLLQADRRRQAWLDRLEEDAEGWIAEADIDERITAALFEEVRVPWQYEEWFANLARARGKKEAQQRAAGTSEAAALSMSDWEADMDGWDSEEAQVGPVRREAELVELEDDITPAELIAGLDRRDLRRERAVRLRRYATKHLLEPGDAVLHADAVSAIPADVAAAAGVDLAKTIFYTLPGDVATLDRVELDVAAEDDDLPNADPTSVEALTAADFGAEALGGEADGGKDGPLSDGSVYDGLVDAVEDGTFEGNNDLKSDTLESLVTRLLPAVVSGRQPQTLAQAEARALSVLAASKLAKPFSERMMQLARQHAAEVRVPPMGSAGAVRFIFDEAGSAAVRAALLREFMPKLPSVTDDAEAAIVTRWWVRLGATVGYREAVGDDGQPVEVVPSPRSADEFFKAIGDDEPTPGFGGDDLGVDLSKLSSKDRKRAEELMAGPAAAGEARPLDDDKARFYGQYFEPPAAPNGMPPDKLHEHAVRLSIATGEPSVVADAKPEPWAPGQLEGADAVLDGQADGNLMAVGGQTLVDAVNPMDPLLRDVTPMAEGPPVLAGTVDIEAGLPWELDGTLAPEEADRLLQEAADAREAGAPFPSEALAASGRAAAAAQLAEERRYHDRAALALDPHSDALRRSAAPLDASSSSPAAVARAVSALARDRAAEQVIGREQPYAAPPGAMVPAADGSGLEPGPGTLPLLVDDGLDLAEETALMDALASGRLQLLRRLLERRRSRLEREAPEILERYDLDAPYRPALEGDPAWQQLADNSFDVAAESDDLPSSDGGGGGAAGAAELEDDGGLFAGMGAGQADDDAPFEMDWADDADMADPLEGFDLDKDPRA